MVIKSRMRIYTLYGVSTEYTVSGVQGLQKLLRTFVSLILQFKHKSHSLIDTSLNNVAVSQTTTLQWCN